jgi:tetratricopeptide (TPR) repeat protein
MKDLDLEKDQNKAMIEPEDLREMLALSPETEGEPDPENLETWLREAGRSLNEAHPMPPIEAPGEELLAARAAEAKPEPRAPIPFMRTNRGIALAVLTAAAASFLLALVLFRDPIAIIENEYKVRLAPPHPEAMDLYDQQTAEALLERAEHLLVLWEFHQDAWYLQEALRNLLQARHYQPEDPRMAEALAKVYENLGQPDKAAEYRALAEELRAE